MFYYIDPDQKYQYLRGFRVGTTFHIITEIGNEISIKEKFRIMKSVNLTSYDDVTVRCLRFSVKINKGTLKLSDIKILSDRIIYNDETEEAKSKIGLVRVMCNNLYDEDDTVLYIRYYHTDKEEVKEYDMVRITTEYIHRVIQENIEEVPKSYKVIDFARLYFVTAVMIKFRDDYNDKAKYLTDLRHINIKTIHDAVDNNFLKYNGNEYMVEYDYSKDSGPYFITHKELQDKLSKIFIYEDHIIIYKLQEGLNRTLYDEEVKKFVKSMMIEAERVTVDADDQGTFVYEFDISTCDIYRLPYEEYTYKRNGLIHHSLRDTIIRFYHDADEYDEINIRRAVNMYLSRLNEKLDSLRENKNPLIDNCIKFNQSIIQRDIFDNRK